MFLRKLLVMAVPLGLAALCAFVLPLLEGYGLWTDALQGLGLGVSLALLLPLSGATKKKEPFAQYLAVPIGVLTLVVGAQLALSLGVSVPIAPANAIRMMVECAFLGFMAVQAVRTRL